MGVDMAGERDRTRGTLDEMKGRVKKAAGEITGDSSKKAEGTADKLRGKVEKATGKAKEEFNRDEDEDI